MKKYLTTAKTYVSDHKKQFKLGGFIALGLAIISAIIVLVIYNTTPHVVYQPPNACNLFTNKEAIEVLGGEVISLGTALPVVSGDAAISKCSYTDKNNDANAMLVAAVAIRSGINDKGVAQNRAQFIASQSLTSTEVVKDLGDNAYFNSNLGQLDVYQGREWFIISVGVGAAPATNTLEDAIKLAHMVIN